MRGRSSITWNRALGGFWVVFGIVCIVRFALLLSGSSVREGVSAYLDCALGLLLGAVLLLGGIGVFREAKWGRMTLLLVLPAVGYFALSLGALFLFKGPRLVDAACCGFVFVATLATWIYCFSSRFCNE